MGRAFVVFVLLLISNSAFSAEKKVVSKQYYRWHEVKKTHVLANEERMELGRGIFILARGFDDGSSSQSWVTGDRDEPIVPDSTILGHRLGKERLGSTIYYRLNDNLNWHAVIPKTKPQLWRRHPQMGDYVAEEPLGEWRTGHDIYPGEEPGMVPIFHRLSELDPKPVARPVEPEKPPTKAPKSYPLPAPKAEPKRVPLPRPKEEPKLVPQPRPKEQPQPEVPVKPAPKLPSPELPPPENESGIDDQIGCKIEAKPELIKVGEMTILSMQTRGLVESAMLDGAAVDVPFVLRGKEGEKQGVVTVVGTVFSKKGKNSCSTKLTVQ